MKIQKKIYPIVNSVIRILLLLIAAGMCLQSLFSTSFVGVVTKEDGALQERTLNIADQPWKHLILFAAVTVVGFVLYRGILRLQSICHKEEHPVAEGQKRSLAHGRNTEEADGETEKEQLRGERNTEKSRGKESVRLLATGTIVTLIMGVVWILVTRLYPGSDPAKVYQVAMQWRRGDFSAYAEGGYLFRYPFQAGIILFYYLLSFLFGIDNYIGLQFVNVIALAAVYGLLVKLSALFWQEDKKLPAVVYAALILWVPLSFYVTYLYGILPGMALSLGAVYFAAKYLHTRRYRYIVPAALCMGLATVIKMNCLIYLVAIACFLLYDALDVALLSKKELGKQWIVSLLCLVLMGLSVAGCNKLCSRYVEYLSGYEAGEGAVMVSWVVMGLQETPLGPGGYSGYINEVFERYDYDTEKITEVSIADIKSIMTRMSENPLDEGIPFFARKNAFQWNDPTFISLDRTKGRKSAGTMPAFAQSLIEGKGSVRLSILLNYAQTLILAGMILYLILDWKSRNIYELMGAVVFLGGYLFHFFWESSASYTIPYFVIIIPYAAKGMADWVRYTDKCLCNVCGSLRQNKGSQKRGEENGAEKQHIMGIMSKKRVWMPVCILLAAVILTAIFSRTNLFRRTIALNDGKEAEEQFYHRGENGADGDRMVAAGISEGYYYLSPYLAQDTALVLQNGKVTLASVIPAAADDGIAAESMKDGENVSFATDGSKSKEEAVTKVSKVRDIENKILLWRESGGTCMRFRSNEQVLAADRSGDVPVLATYLDDGMNSFYEPREKMAYHWNIRPAGSGGYYIVGDDLALTCRNGEVTLEALEESEEQRWVLQW